MCTDSNMKHGFIFTPFSIYITCDSEKEINNLYEELITDGRALMLLGDYGFSKKLVGLMIGSVFRGNLIFRNKFMKDTVNLDTV